MKKLFVRWFSLFFITEAFVIGNLSRLRHCDEQDIEISARKKNSLPKLQFSAENQISFIHPSIKFAKKRKREK